MKKEFKKSKGFESAVNEVGNQVVEAVVETIEDIKVVNDKKDSTELSTDSVNQIVLPAHRRVANLTDKPLLIIGGKEIELKKVAWKLPYGYASYFYKNRANILAPVSDSSKGIWLYQELSKDDVEWYSAKVNDVEFILSSGSSVVINKNIGCANDWVGMDEFGDVSIDASDSKIVVIGSKVNCDSLYSMGDSTLNNTSINAELLTLESSKILSSRIVSKQYVRIEKSNVEMSNFNAKSNINLLKSSVFGVDLGYFNYITLDNAKSYHDNKFKVNISGASFEESSFTARNVYFATHEGNHFMSNECDKSFDILVDRRIDFGYFSGIAPIPFIRSNNDTILVGNRSFKYSEFYPDNYIKQESNNNSYKGPYTGSYSLAPNPGALLPGSEPTWVSQERNGTLWKKAADVIFTSHRERPLGRISDELIKSLLEQIRSRLSVYVELNSVS